MAEAAAQSSATTQKYIEKSSYNMVDTDSTQFHNDQPVHSGGEQAIAPISPDLLKSLEWRLIGPYRGGRVVAVAGDPVHAQVFYFGSTGGGVWKTTDGGVYWENISDGYFQRASVGAIAVASSDPNVIYVGMGETCIPQGGYK